MGNKKDIAHEVETLLICCTEALNGEWDKGDDGFVALGEGVLYLAKLLGIELPSKSVRQFLETAKGVEL